MDQPDRPATQPRPQPSAQPTAPNQQLPTVKRWIRAKSLPGGSALTGEAGAWVCARPPNGLGPTPSTNLVHR
jgi:hypothetical protein